MHFDCLKNWRSLTKSTFFFLLSKEIFLSRSHHKICDFFTINLRKFCFCSVVLQNSKIFLIPWKYSLFSSDSLTTFADFRRFFDEIHGFPYDPLTKFAFYRVLWGNSRFLTILSRNLHRFRDSLTKFIFSRSPFTKFVIFFCKRPIFSLTVCRNSLYFFMSEFSDWCQIFKKFRSRML